jgi:hypothetical protein
MSTDSHSRCSSCLLPADPETCGKWTAFPLLAAGIHIHICLPTTYSGTLVSLLLIHLKECKRNSNQHLIFEPLSTYIRISRLHIGLVFCFQLQPNSHIPLIFFVYSLLPRGAHSSAPFSNHHRHHHPCHPISSPPRSFLPLSLH